MTSDVSHTLKPAGPPSFSTSDDLQARSIPSSIDSTSVLSEYLDRLQKSLANPSVESLQNVLFTDGFWRDHLFLTWDLRTLRGIDKVSEYLSSSKKTASITFSAPEKANYKRQPLLNTDDALNPMLTAYIDVESEEGIGEGVVRLLVDKDGVWKAFTIYTCIKSLKGHPEINGSNRPQGGLHGDQSSDPRNWKEKITAAHTFPETSPTVLIIGAGQSGLALAARLTQLGISTLLIDKNPRIGDNWRNRYHSLVLHDQVWYDHLPYFPFPTFWPEFTPKDKMGDWLEQYASFLELPVWTSSTPISSSVTYDEKNGEWSITVSRSYPDGSVTDQRRLTPKHIVLATGHAGLPNIPSFKNSDLFHGSITHSSQWHTPSRLTGKKVLIVGACNTAHDIAQSLVAVNAHPIILQRSSTYVISSRHGLPALMRPLYCEDGPAVEEADLLAFGTPNALTKFVHQAVTKMVAEDEDKDGPVLKGLQEKGFQLDYGPDKAGLLMKYFERGGGYYIDIGASQMIVDGKIGVVGGRGGIREFTESGVVFDDGSVEEGVEEVVLATGYQNMRTSAGLILPCVKDKVKTVWGFDEEGELQTMFRDSGHPGFYFMGGNLAHVRYFSKFLALKIAGKEWGYY